jgi:serine/threonine protein phosphatase PrpC
MRACSNTEPADSHFVISGRHLYSGGHAESIGCRPSMEDCCSVIGEFAGPNTQFYGLYDGHGGAAVSQHLSVSLHPAIAAKYADTNSWPDAIRAGFAEVQATAVEKWPFQGSTAAIAIIANSTIYSANVGDSRIVIIDETSATRVSKDHHVDDPEEQAAVLGRGGLIFNGRVNGSLMLTRTIGDGSMADALSAEPHLHEAPWSEDLKLVLACDGVWDVLDEARVAEIVRASPDPGSAARAVKDEAMSKGSDDNISIICVSLKPKE